MLQLQVKTQMTMVMKAMKNYSTFKVLGIYMVMKVVM